MSRQAETEVDAELCRNEPIGVNESGNNLRTITPKHREERGSKADQKARQVNKIDVPALSAKPPSPVQIRAAPSVFIGNLRRLFVHGTSNAPQMD
jgi:hypothetical protein